MDLNENSSKREILNWIKIDPFYFLRNVTGKVWAQPYIDEAAKKAAKEKPYYFLRKFSSKTWAQPYIDDAVREVAKLDPQYFLEELAARFPQGINWALFALGSKNETK